MIQKIVLMIVACIPAIAIVIVAGTITGVVLWKKWQAKKDTTAPQPPPPQTPKAKKGYGWLLWLVVIVVAVILTWGFSTSWGKSTAATTPVKSSGTQVVIPKEIWAFRWVTPAKSQNLSVEIVENRNGVFRAVLHDINGHGRDERVAGLTLRWEGENLLGTWTDYVDGGGGNAYLYKASTNLWSGWWECNNGKIKVHIEMKRE
jgi:hypothetical protein